MKRLNVIIKHPGCVNIRIKDGNEIKCIYSETDNIEKIFEVDIIEESFDLILTPMMPSVKTSGSKKLKDKLKEKFISATESFAKDMYFFAECIYHVEKFNDGDTISINMTVYYYPSNNSGASLIDLDVVLFPVQYLFYDALLNDQRLEPKGINCLNRKKVIKRAIPFLLIGSDGIQIISYPLQMIRIRRLSRPRKIYSKLLEFSKMNFENRIKYTDDDNLPGIFIS